MCAWRGWPRAPGDRARGSHRQCTKGRPRVTYDSTAAKTRRSLLLPVQVPSDSPGSKTRRPCHARVPHAGSGNLTPNTYFLMVIKLATFPRISPNQFVNVIL